MADQLIRVFRFVRTLADEVEEAPGTQYREGYLDALSQVQQYVEELAWDEGTDLEEE